MLRKAVDEVAGLDGPMRVPVAFASGNETATRSFRAFRVLLSLALAGETLQVSRDSELRLSVSE